MFCPHCGGKLVDNAKFCQDCGKKVEMPVQSSGKEEPAKKPKNKKKTLRWIVIAVILLVLLKLLFSCGNDGGGKGKPVKAEPPILPNFILSDSSDRFWINSWGETSASFWAECHDGELCYIGDEYVNLLLEQGYTIVELEEDGGNIANKDWLLMQYFLENVGVLVMQQENHYVEKASMQMKVRCEKTALLLQKFMGAVCQ